MMSFGVKSLRRKLATTSRQQVDEILAHFLSAHFYLTSFDVSVVFVF